MSTSINPNSTTNPGRIRIRTIPNTSNFGTDNLVYPGQLIAKRLTEDSGTDAGTAYLRVGGGGSDSSANPSKAGLQIIPEDNTITTDMIKNSAITSAKLGTGVITSAKISNNAVTNDKISTGAITSDKISTGAITSAKLGTGAVTSDKLGSIISTGSASSGGITVTLAQTNSQGGLKIGVSVNASGIESGSAVWAGTAGMIGSKSSSGTITYTSIGNTTTPVYINGGTFYACEPSSMSVNYATTSGSSTSAGKLNVSQQVGDTNTPVYFTSNGVPAVCTPSNMVVGYATKAKKLVNDNNVEYNISGPIQLVNGVPTEYNISNITVDTANKLSTTSIGNENIPVYFTSGGVPAQISQLALSKGGTGNNLAQYVDASNSSSNKYNNGIIVIRNAPNELGIYPIENPSSIGSNTTIPSIYHDAILCKHGGVNPYNTYDPEWRNSIRLSGSITSDSTITAASFNATSDRRLKTRISKFKYNKSILDLPIYRYKFKDDNEFTIGCMAQDLQELYPELVHQNDNDKYLSISENKLVYLLVEEVKLLRKDLEVLRTRSMV